jgi:hypothetical protein
VRASQGERDLRSNVRRQLRLVQNSQTLHRGATARTVAWIECSGRVLARFGARMAILLAFAMFGSNGFSRSLAALMWMAIVLAALVPGIIAG